MGEGSDGTGQLRGGTRTVRGLEPVLGVSDTGKSRDLDGLHD